MEAESQLLLAMETGGTKTILRLLDIKGNTIAETQVAGVANTDLNVMPVEQVLKDGLEKLTGSVESIGYAFCSVGGPNAPEVDRAMRKLLSPSAKVQVEREGNGVMILPAAKALNAPAAVLAGTGAVAFAEKDGHYVMSGGWGPLWGDEGSGGHLGRQALRRRIQEVDGRLPASRLAELFADLEAGLDLPTYQGRVAFMSRIFALTRAQIAHFAPDIFRLANEGDAAAAELVADEANHIAALAAAITNETPVAGMNNVLACGGLFQAGEAFRQLCTEALHKRRPAWNWRFLKSSSMIGPASRMVLQMAGCTDEALLRAVIE